MSSCFKYEDDCIIEPRPATAPAEKYSGNKGTRNVSVNLF